MSNLAHVDVEGRPIACRVLAGSSPALLFLPGYASDMEGTKALALAGFAETLGLAMVRFDYSGTGSSSGDFEDGTLDRWLAEALCVMDRLSAGPTILVGSSMGGWLALHLALRRPKRVQALVGIAAAPDFTQWGFSDDQKQALVRDGRIEEPNPYGPKPSVFTKEFWESGQALRVLASEIAIDCPVRLLHGECDREVPLGIGFELMRALRSSDVQLNVLKGGGHRLSDPHEIRSILETVRTLLEPQA